MTETTPQYAGVPVRDQDVRLDVTAAEAVEAGRSQRTRLLDAVESLTDDEWMAQSRCAQWSVQDVVRHLVHVTSMSVESIEAARTGARYDGFSAAKFNPKETPHAFLTALGAEPAEATREAFAASTARVIAAMDELSADKLLADDDVLVATPIGRQVWHRSLLHGLFDSAVHERDILAPFGRKPDPTPPAEEVRAIASYQVLLVARILAVVGAPVDLALRLTGGPDLRVRVAGPLVSVSSGDLDGATAEARGEVDAVLDAMTGRGQLAEVLDAPPEVVMGLSALSSLV